MRSKKAGLNIASKFSYQLVVLICGLITPRLILQAFGSTYNGAISSITQFFSLISVLTIGLAGATRVELYKTLANNDLLGTSRIVKATSQFLHKVGIALIGYAIVLSFVMPNVLQDQLPKHETALLVAIVFITTFAQYFFGLTYSTLLQADQKEYIYTVFQLIATVLNTLIAVVLIKIGASIFVVKFCGSALFAAVPILLSVVVRKRYKLIKECVADNTAIKQRASAMFHSIANIIHDNTDILLLTVFTDAKTISVYSVYCIVVRNIKQIMQNFVTGLEAAFGSMWAKKEYDNFIRCFNTYELLVFSFSSVVFTCVGLLLIPFIGLYTDGITDVEYIRPFFAVLLTITEGVFCLRQPYVTIVQAAGHYKQTKNSAMVEAIINLVCSLFLIGTFGLNGAVGGTLIANCFRTTQYAIYSSKNLIHRDFRCFITKIGWHLMNTSIIVVIYKMITVKFVISTWSHWILAGMIAFLISLLVTGGSALLFYRKESMHAWSIVKKMLTSKRSTK